MIRLIQPEKDAPAIKQIYAPFVTDTAVTFEYTVPSDAEFYNRIQQTASRFPWLVWETSTGIHGYAYASAAHWNGRHSSGRRIYPYILNRSISGKETADICIGHCMVYWQPRDTILYTQQFPTRILPAVCFIHTKDLPKPPVFRQPVLSLTGGMI